MDISTDRSKSDGNQPGSFAAVWQTLKGFLGRLIGFFMLTKEERSKAGIYLGGEGRDG